MNDCSLTELKGAIRHYKQTSSCSHLSKCLSVIEELGVLGFVCLCLGFVWLVGFVLVCCLFWFCCCLGLALSFCFVVFCLSRVVCTVQRV